jgi:hypothetical protein
MTHVADALFWILVGAVLGGVIQAAVSRYAVVKESQGIALAIAAELSALRELVTFRNYQRIADQVVSQLEQPGHVVTLFDILAISITQDYFVVFHGVSSKIGTLGTMSGEVVKAYTFAKALLEDFAQLSARAREMTDPSKLFGIEIAPEDRPAANDILRQLALAYSQDVQRLLKTILESQIIENLQAWARTSWVEHFLNQ